MGSKKVLYVDTNDKIVGSGTIQDAYKAGYAVRISRIFIINNKGEVLLQKRNGGVFSSSKWDQSAGGHVDEGETYLTAAKRELIEEMGIQNVSLTQVETFYTEDKPFEHVRKRFNRLYYGFYSGLVVIDGHEVSDYLWISPNQLGAWIQQKPNDFTHGFLISYVKLQQVVTHQK